MIKILITGGLGFIGSNLTEYLIKKKKFKLFIIDNLSSNKVSISKSGIKLFKVDINNINKINFLKKNVDVVIHLAASAEILIKKESEKKYFLDNVSGLQEVLNFCVRNKVKNLFLLHHHLFMVIQKIRK